MYAQLMKRLQILIDEDLDLALDRLARRTGQSKSALISQFVREGLQSHPPLSADPLGRKIGVDDFDPLPIHDVVYR